MADGTTVFLRGEGGVVWEHDLPLPEGIQGRLERGHLTRVADAAGNPLPTQAAEQPAGPPPASATKAAWVGYAVSHGARPDDADAMTKADLMQTYGAGGTTT